MSDIGRLLAVAVANTLSKYSIMYLKAYSLNKDTYMYAHLKENCILYVHICTHIHTNTSASKSTAEKTLILSFYPFMDVYGGHRLQSGRESGLYCQR